MIAKQLVDAVEEKWWITRRFVLNFSTYLDNWRYDRKFKPHVGQPVSYHDNGPYLVLNIDGDDLTIETPEGVKVVSWRNCCDPWTNLRPQNGLD